MLEITIPSVELWDDAKQEFVYTKEQKLRLEHSLVSLSKWESRWCKPFLSKQEKTLAESIDYIKCMTLTKNVDPTVYEYLTAANVKDVDEYIHSPMTATRIYDTGPDKRNNEQITSELIYYWMVSFGIPAEYEKWHLNRLLTLIRVCNVKNQPTKKTNKKIDLAERARINAERKAKLNTKG